MNTLLPKLWGEFKIITVFVHIYFKENDIEEYPQLVNAGTGEVVSAKEVRVAIDKILRSDMENGEENGELFCR